MQNLMGCPKGQCIVSKKLYKYLITNFHSKTPIHNLKSIDVGIHKKIRNALIPISYHVLKQMRVDSEKVEFVFPQKLFSHRYNGPFFQSNRHFSTSRINAQDSNKQSSSDPDKNTDKDKQKKSDNDSKDNFNGVPILMMKLFNVCLLFYILKNILFRPQDNMYELPKVVSWNEFVYQMLAKGEVRRLSVSLPSNLVYIELHPGAVINGKVNDTTRYFISVSNPDELEEKLRAVERKLGIRYEDYLPVEYNRNSDGMLVLFQFSSLLLLVLIGLALRNKFKSVNPMNVFSKMQRARFTLVEPHGTRKGVHFSDVAGLSEAKVEVMEFVDYLKNPTRYKLLGAKIPRGALLLGPPGCGKTLLAKAIATEASVPFLSINGTEFMELLGGLGPARVRDLFKEAKKRAPSIIYIDEIDTIGKNRSYSKDWSADQEGERTLNQLLVEMDGMASSGDVIVLASTNRPQILDGALLRPGRFDRKILIDLPTTEERRQIFETHLKSLVLDAPPSKYSKYLAHLTPQFSGADIANICNEAALYAARFKKKKVEISDLMYAIDKTFGGVEKKSHAMTPTEKRVVAYRKAGQTLLSWLLEHTSSPIKVSMVPRTNYALGFVHYLQSPMHLESREVLLDKMAALLGARVAEQIIFNQVSHAPKHNELKLVTNIAYRQVKDWGMSPAVGLISFGAQDKSFEEKPYSKQLQTLMDVEARNIVAGVYKRAEEVLVQNKDKLIVLAEALLEKETLTYKDIEQLIGPPPFKKKLDDTLGLLDALTETIEQREEIVDKPSSEGESPVPSQPSI